MRRSELIFGLSLLALFPFGCADRTPAGANETDTDEGSTGPEPGEADPSTTGETDEGEETSSSSSTTDEPSTSTGPGSLCGDGMVDDGEACDDGNDEDADGCNSDCTVSGSILWTHELPFGTDPERIVVDAEDRVHLVAVADAQVLYFVFEPDGELRTPVELDVPFDMPAEADELERRVDGFGLSLEGRPIISVTDGFFVDDDLLSATYRLISEDPAWVHTPEMSGLLHFHVTEDGRTVGMGGDGFFDISSSGELLATGPWSYARQIAADEHGAALAGRDLLFHDRDGSVVWTVDWPSGNLTGLTAVDRFANGDVLASGQVGESLLEASQIRLSRYAPDGTEVSSWVWPEEPSEAGPGYGCLAITPAGHIAFPASHLKERFLWKLDENYETRWRVELPTDPFPLQLHSDSRGALVFMTRDTVGKIAP